MQRNTLYILAAAVALASCSGAGSDVVEPTPTPQPAAGIGFRAEVSALSDTGTRAGAVGTLGTDELKAQGLTGGGFGVFAYFTGSDAYEIVNPAGGTQTLPPNFMYNQLVWWDSYDRLDWVYSPLKYWPNDNQPADDEGAQGSVAQSRVSFFAYAPWVDHTAASLGTTGITALSANATPGDPTVTYVLNAAIPAEQVDLLWGTRGKDTYQEADGTPNTEAALLNTDLTKQTTTERVDFRFRHALTCLDVYVQRVYDELTPSGKKPAADHSKIFVSQLRLDYPAGQMVQQGTLNLARGTWGTAASTFGAGNLTIGQADIAPALQGTLATDLATVQHVELDPFGSKSGATESLQRLTDLTYATMLIPASGNTGLTVTPTITYDFVTQDPALELSLPNSAATQHYARICHTVQGSPVNIGTEYDDGGVKKYRLEAGKRYILVCYIGVESVQFQVIGIEDWDFPMRYTTSIAPFTPETKDKTIKE